jgi:hypothetical protein
MESVADRSDGCIAIELKKMNMAAGPSHASQIDDNVEKRL